MTKKLTRKVLIYGERNGSIRGNITRAESALLFYFLLVETVLSEKTGFIHIIREINLEETGQHSSLTLGYNYFFILNEKI
jgi:hypothetical protein